MFVVLFIDLEMINIFVMICIGFSKLHKYILSRYNYRLKQGIEGIIQITHFCAESLQEEFRH